MSADLGLEPFNLAWRGGAQRREVFPSATTIGSEDFSSMVYYELYLLRLCMPFGHFCRRYGGRIEGRPRDGIESLLGLRIAGNPNDRRRDRVDPGVGREIGS